MIKMEVEREKARHWTATSVPWGVVGKGTSKKKAETQCRELTFEHCWMICEALHRGNRVYVGEEVATLLKEPNSELIAVNPKLRRPSLRVKHFRPRTRI